MPAKLKPILIWSAVAFCAYLILASPDLAGETVKSAYNMASHSISQIGKFFHAIIN